MSETTGTQEAALRAPAVVVVVGASAGGVGTLLELTQGLPGDFAGAVCIVLHSAPEAPARLPLVLSRRSRLPVAHAVDGEAIGAGRVYVAPPDRHLIVRPGHLHLSRGPRENGTRPAIDPLFRSAAASYGARSVGVVLTGTLDDGTAGLLAIEQAGGATLVQDPEDAAFPDMPRNALAYVRVTRVLPVADIPAALAELAAAAEAAPDGASTSAGAEFLPEPIPPESIATSLSCPECLGSLWQVPLGELTEWRCRVGHRYAPESLLFHMGERRGEVIETALRSLDEEATLSDRLSERAEAGDDAIRARRYAKRAEVARRRASALRELLEATGSY